MGASAPTYEFFFFFWQGEGKIRSIAASNYFMLLEIHIYILNVSSCHALWSMKTGLHNQNYYYYKRQSLKGVYSPMQSIFLFMLLKWKDWLCLTHISLKMLISIPFKVIYPTLISKVLWGKIWISKNEKNTCTHDTKW